MSLATSLLPAGILARIRPGGPTHRAALDIDAGALVGNVSTYPYPSGARPIRPHELRHAPIPTRARQVRQLTPPHGSIAQRSFAHLDYLNRRGAVRSATRDTANVRSPAKIVRTRPWLFSGGSSASSAPPTPAGLMAGPCDGCG